MFTFRSQVSTPQFGPKSIDLIESIRIRILKEKAHFQKECSITDNQN